MSENDKETELDAALAGLGAGAGIIAGRHARIANLQTLQQAKNSYRFVDSAKSSAEMQALMNVIWQETGWYRGPDGEWKFEIPEAGAKFKFLQSDSQLEPAPDWTSAGTLADADRPLGVRAEGQLKDFLDFPALYEAYPGLENTRTGQIRLEDNVRGVFNDQLGFGVSHRLPIEDASSTLLHEVQHGIQRLEGFGLGGNPETVGELFPEDAAALGGNEAYSRLGGETEARLVQKRLWHALGPDPGAYSIFPLWDQSRFSADQLIYSMPPAMPPEGNINALHLPPGRAQHILPDSLPVSHEMKMHVPETSLGETGAFLLSLLKRAFK